MDLTRSLASAWTRFVDRFGPLWIGTKLTGYAANGPYHCEDCKYLSPDRDAQYWQGRCDNRLVMLDPQVPKDAKGKAIVNVETGCCTFFDDGH